MATRYGWAVRGWLLERGWLPDDTVQPDDWVGDVQVVDPVTLKQTNVYQAATLQRIRKGQYPDFLKDDDEPFLAEKLIDFSILLPRLGRFFLIVLIGMAFFVLLALACG